MKENLFIHQIDEFEKGILNNLVVLDSKLILKDGSLSGSYESTGYKTSDFKSLISSWNVNLNEGSSLEVMYSVYDGIDWSEFYTYGNWEINNNFSNSQDLDNIAYIDIDNLILKNGKNAKEFKYKVLFERRSSKNKGPELSRINTTIKLVNHEKIPNIKLDKSLNVPKRSQLNIPKIGNQICSPTSIAMVMEYYGIDIKTEVAAELVFDKGAEIYGNWSYNASLPGQYGLLSYVEILGSIDEIKEYINMEIPVIASIRTVDKNHLSGSIMAYPSGHLLVVKGFMTEEEIEYVIVNDPAEHSEDKVERKYILDEFIKAWRGVVYIIRSEEK